MINLRNLKLGYYTVGQSRYKSKIDALIAGTKLNVHPKWHFNDDVWNSINWTQEPEIDILELYKIRARQIRDQYDYVIVNYSGGSDSETLVNAFLDSNCHIDEIVTIWNRAHTKTVVAQEWAVDSRNIEAEFDLTTRQGLENIRNRSPKTKISYYDVSSATLDCFNRYDGEEWLTTTTEHLNPHYVTRWCATREKQQLLTLDKGHKVAVVSGIDKPRISIKDGRYCVTFIDTIVNNNQGGYNNSDYNNWDTVFFFWDPDLPEIVVKQAHLIKKWFNSNPALKPLLLWPNHDFIKRQAYEVISRAIIYPQWNLSTFQCQKTKSAVWCDWDDWFFTGFKNTAVYSAWYKGIEYVEKNVDKKYLKYTFDNKFDGFVGMINGHFYLESADSVHGL